MGTDLCVIPTLKTPILCRALTEMWKSCLPAEGRNALGNPAIREMDFGVKRPALHDTQALEVDRVYVFDLAIGNTLSLYVPSAYGGEPSADRDAERECLEDFGGNLKPGEVDEISAAWKKAGGHDFSLSTQMGRPPIEPLLFVALGYSLARLCDGYMYFGTDDILTDVPQGVWKPEVYASAEIRGYNSTWRLDVAG